MCTPLPPPQQDVYVDNECVNSRKIRFPVMVKDGRLCTSNDVMSHQDLIDGEYRAVEKIILKLNIYFAQIDNALYCDAGSVFFQEKNSKEKTFSKYTQS